MAIRPAVRTEEHGQEVSAKLLCQGLEIDLKDLHCDFSAYVSELVDDDGDVEGVLVYIPGVESSELFEYISKSTEEEED